MKIVAGIVGIVAFIIVGAWAIPFMEDVVQEDVDVPEWSYDDYKLIDGAVSASGSLEIVSTHMGETVHAVSVGPGTITYTDGRVESVNVGRAVLDVYLMTGQSNACYSSADPSLADPIPKLGTSYAWMRESGDYAKFASTDDPAMRPMVGIDGQALTGDKAPAFAATVTELTGHKVYWICGGWGDMSIASFDPDGGIVWNYMLQVVSEAMDAIDRQHFDVHTCYYMWIQGEKDRSMPVEEYIERFKEMHDAILSGKLGYTFSHCFISQIMEKWGNAVDALYEIADTVPHVSMGSTAALGFTQANGLLSSDNIHYSQLGDNIIGSDLGTACGELRLQEPSTKGTNALMGILPTIFGITVGVLAVMAAVKLVMGRD